MPGLGGEGGVQRLADADEGGLGVEGGAAVGPFQLEGGRGQSGLDAEGDHAGEAGVVAQPGDAGAVGVVEVAGADDQTGRGVDLLAQRLERRLQRAGGEAVQRRRGDDAGGGEGQFGRLFAMGLGHLGQGRNGGRERLADGRQGHGLQAFDLGEGGVARLEPGLGDEGVDLGQGVGAFGRAEAGGVHDAADRVEFGVEGEGGAERLSGHVSRSTRRLRPGRPA